VVAVAADLAIWILLYIYARPEGTPSEYKNVAMPVLLALACSLFLIYGVSIIFRAMRLRRKIGAFEIAQSILAFLLAAFSTLRFGASAGPPILGVVCLLFSAAGYAVAYACLDQSLEQRNFHVCATWSAALFLTGLAICLPTLPLALCLSVGAILATLLGGWSHRQTLEFHGLAYLAAAGYASGLLSYMSRALMGTFPVKPGWIVWMAGASAVACYVIGARFRTELGIQRILRLAFALFAVSAAITFSVSVLMWLAALSTSADASQVAVIRTLIACLVAVALSFGGSRWHLSELIWVAYATLALVTMKLLLEDLRNGSAGSRAVSIFLYAVTLILVPRMASLEHRVKTN